MGRLTKIQRKVLARLEDYGAFSEEGRYIEPSVGHELSNRAYLDLRARGLFDEQFNFLCGVRPFLAITPAGRSALAEKGEGR